MFNWFRRLFGGQDKKKEHLDKVKKDQVRDSLFHQMKASRQAAVSGTHECPKCGGVVGPYGVCDDCGYDPADKNQLAPGKSGKASKKSVRSIFDPWEVTQDQ